MGVRQKRSWEAISFHALMTMLALLALLLLVEPTIVALVVSLTSSFSL